MTTALLANSLTITGATSGTTTLDVTATTSGTLTLPAGTGTVTVGGVNSNLVLVNTPPGGAITVVGSVTSVGFTGIPSWVRKITLMLNQVSTNGTADLLVQLGNASGYTSIGYVSEGIMLTTAAAPVANTGGFILPTSGSAASNSSGMITLCNQNSGTGTLTYWTMNATITSQGGTAGVSYSAGESGLGITGQLDRIQLISAGADSIDAGRINILYE